MKCEKCEYKSMCDSFGKEESLIQSCLKETEYENQLLNLKEIMMSDNDYNDETVLQRVQEIADLLKIKVYTKTDGIDGKRFRVEFTEKSDPSLSSIWGRLIGEMSTEKFNKFRNSVLSLCEKNQLPITEIIVIYPSTKKGMSNRITINVKNVLDEKKISDSLKDLVASEDSESTNTSLKQRLLDAVEECRSIMKTSKITYGINFEKEVSADVVERITTKYLTTVVKIIEDSFEKMDTERKGLILSMRRIRDGIMVGSIFCSDSSEDYMTQDASVFLACSNTLYGKEKGLFTEIEKPFIKKPKTN